MVLVKIARMGKRLTEFALQDGSDLSKLMVIAGIGPLIGEEVIVNGAPTSNMSLTLHDKDLIIVQPIKTTPKFSIKIGRVGQAMRIVDVDEKTTVGNAIKLSSVAMFTGDDIWMAKEGSTDPHQLVSQDVICRPGDIIILEERNKRREIEKILGQYDIDAELDDSDFRNLVNQLAQIK